MGWSEWYERSTAVTASVSAQGSGVLLLFSVIALNFNTEALQRDVYGECYVGCDAVMSVSATSSQMASSGMGCPAHAVSGGLGVVGEERAE